MSKPLSFILALLIACTAASAASSRYSYNDRYGVISDRNIFLKDRSHPATRPSSTQPSHMDPERAMTLTGIVFEDNAYHAYLENRDTNTVQRVSVGDAIAKGKITDIGIDGIVYVNTAGQRVPVTVGFDLTGQAAAAVDPLALPSLATTMPSGVEGLNINDPNLTMEQRMKLKRMAELKGK